MLCPSGTAEVLEKLWVSRTRRSLSTHCWQLDNIHVLVNANLFWLILLTANSYITHSFDERRIVSYGKLWPFYHWLYAFNLGSSTFTNQTFYCHLTIRNMSYMHSIFIFLSFSPSFSFAFLWSYWLMELSLPSPLLPWLVSCFDQLSAPNKLNCCIIYQGLKTSETL